MKNIITNVQNYLAKTSLYIAILSEVSYLLKIINSYTLLAIVILSNVIYFFNIKVKCIKIKYIKAISYIVLAIAFADTTGTLIYAAYVQVGIFFNELENWLLKPWIIVLLISIAIIGLLYCITFLPKINSYYNLHFKDYKSKFLFITLFIFKLTLFIVAFLVFQVGIYDSFHNKIFFCILGIILLVIIVKLIIWKDFIRYPFFESEDSYINIQLFIDFFQSFVTFFYIFLILLSLLNLALNDFLTAILVLSFTFLITIFSYWKEIIKTYGDDSFGLIMVILTLVPILIVGFYKESKTLGSVNISKFIFALILEIGALLLLVVGKDVSNIVGINLDNDSYKWLKLKVSKYKLNISNWVILATFFNTILIITNNLVYFDNWITKYFKTNFNIKLDKIALLCFLLIVIVLSIFIIGLNFSKWEIEIFRKSLLRSQYYIKGQSESPINLKVKKSANIDRTKLCEYLGIFNWNSLIESISRCSDSIRTINCIDVKYQDKDKILILPLITTIDMNKIDELNKKGLVLMSTTNSNFAKGWQMILQSTPQVVKLDNKMEYGDIVYKNTDVKKYVSEGRLLTKEFSKYFEFNDSNLSSNKNNEFFSKKNIYNVLPEFRRSSYRKIRKKYTDKVINWIDSGDKVFYEIQPIFATSIDTIPIGNRILALDLITYEQFHIFIPNIKSSIKRDTIADYRKLFHEAKVEKN